MIQEVLDEVLEGEPLYTLKDNVGNVLNDNVAIDLKTRLVQEGTPLNRAFFRNLQGDLYSADRYNQLEMNTEVVPVDYGTDVVISETFKQGNILSGPWEDIGNGKYYFNGITIWDDIADDGSSSSSAGVLSIFDGDNSTGYSKVGTNISLMIKFPKPIKLTKLKLSTMDSWFNTTYIRGNNEETGTFTQLHSTGGHTNGELVEKDLDLSDFYQYYRVDISSYSGRLTAFYELQVLEYYEREYGLYKHTATLSVPLTSYEKGKKVSIIGGRGLNPATGPEYLESYKNPYLSINNIEAKQINGTIEYGERYELIYNGESWDISSSKTIYGSFTGTVDWLDFDLGFKPDLVIIYSSLNNGVGVTNSTGSSTLKYLPMILTKAYTTSSGGQITDNGFRYKDYKIDNTDYSIEHYYIAIKL